VELLNLGIVAHVDAGKTSLTERLLYAAGVIDEIGSVDGGSTQTDTLALERRRGITIKAAVVSFAIGDVAVNLIDTPGHPDFIAEVERVLGVLDGAVLVVSAVEGVQPQTRVLFRTLKRLGIPTLLFVNKTDRAAADPDRVVADIRRRLTPDVVPMDAGFGSGIDPLADHDDELLAAYLDGGVSRRELREALVAQTRAGLVHPVFFGSAITGAGVDALRAGIAELLPASGRDDGELSGTVFKIERGSGGERIAYVRLFSGAVHVRDRLPAGKVTAIGVCADGTVVPRDVLAAGEIGQLRGLGDVRIGDALGRPPRPAESAFAPPTLETVVVPRDAADRGALHVALTQLAEQDPLIGLHGSTVTLYGEVQKEVIQATLADDFGVAAEFRETTAIRIERVTGTGEAAEIMKADTNPFLATVGLRVEPGPDVEFRLEVELGSMPAAFMRAVEETVYETLAARRITGCIVTLTQSGYSARQSHSHATFDKSMSSTAGDFRELTPIVLLRAVREAGTRVEEPLHRFRLEVPADALGELRPLLGRLRALPEPPWPLAEGYALEGEIPAAHVHELRRRLPGLTRGEGVVETEFARYAAACSRQS
jgi:ribosomal protection tetracycline resistance protein